MTELALFRPGIVPRQFPAIDFDFATLQQVTVLKGHQTSFAELALRSEWRDPVALWEELT